MTPKDALSPDAAPQARPREELKALIHEMRDTHIRFDHGAGRERVVFEHRVDDWVDRLERLLFTPADAAGNKAHDEARAIITRMRSDAARFRVFPGSGEVVDATHVDEWADELETALAGDAAGTPHAPQGRLREWRCFHCDDVFTDRAEALEHFGETMDDDPLCKIKADEDGLAGEVRRLQKELDEAYADRNSYENDARLWHESEADRVRRIGNHQWWFHLDCLEGEKLVLQERVAELEKLITTADAAGTPKEQEKS